MQKRYAIYVKIMVLFLFLANESFSTNYTSFGTGPWNDPWGWSPYGVPGAGDDATINFGDVKTLSANAQCRHLTMDGTAGSTNTLNIGAYTFTASGNVNINGGSFSNYNAKITIGNGSLNITGNLTMNASVASRAVLDMSSGSGTVTLTGSFVVNTTGQFGCGTGTFIYNGAGAQNVVGATYYNLTLTGGGLKSLAGGGATVNGKMSMQSTATFSLATYALTYGASSSLEYKSASAQTTGPELTTSNQPTNLIIDNSNASGVTLNSNNVSVSTITLTTGPFKLNSKTLNVTSSATTAVSRTSGYIVSETASASPGGGTGPAGAGYGTLTWSIGSTTGAHIFPFATAAGVYLPFTANLVSGDAGVFSISTYVTAANNAPYPNGVAHVKYGSNTEIDNSANVVDRFWVTSKSGGTGNLTLTFAYAQLAERPTTSTDGGYEANLKAQMWGSASWALAKPSQTASIGGGTASSNSSVTLPGVTSTGIWALSKNISPLPVTLIAFNGKLEGILVKLTWATASENNSDKYIIERSADGRHFSKLGEVKSAGFSTYRRDYEFSDANLSNSSYYRLKEVDFDGSYMYSPIVFINQNNQVRAAYVNSESQACIQSGLEGAVTIRITDLTGRIIKNEEKQAYAGEILNVDMSGELTGIYFLNVFQAGNLMFASKLFKK